MKQLIFNLLFRRGKDKKPGAVAGLLWRVGTTEIDTAK